MIILDTNVISEMMKSSPAEGVLKWLNQQDAIDLYITTVTIAEIAYGLHALTNGQRKTALEIAFNKVIKIAFKHRILAFDESAAHLYGKIMGSRKLSGRPMSILDGQIAAIARTQDGTLATRNVKDFVDCDIDLVNPFL